MSNRHQRRVAISESRKRGSWDWQELPTVGASGVLRNIRRCVRNDFWIVQIYDFYSELSPLAPMTHLMIRSVAMAGTDRGAEPRWRDMQRIKNELCGDRAEAVQVYPQADDVMDQADMYHLFVWPGDRVLPFGLHRECGFAR